MVIMSNTEKYYERAIEEIIKVDGLSYKQATLRLTALLESGVIDKYKTLGSDFSKLIIDIALSIPQLKE